MGFMDKCKRSPVNKTGETLNEGGLSIPTAPEATKPPQNNLTNPHIEPPAGYLTFDPTSNGTLFITWSKTAVGGAFAMVKPVKTVPEHKFKTNGGKNEIIRNLMADKLKYYEGWVQFVKAGKAFDSVFTLLPAAESAPLKVDLAFLQGNKVVTVETNASLQLKQYTAIGAVPRGNSSYHVHTIAKDTFLGKTQGIGASLAF